MARPGFRFQLRKERARALEHGRMIKPPDRANSRLDLAAEKDIGRSGEIVAQGEVLLDDLYSFFPRLDGLGELDRLTLYPDIPASRRKVAGDNLHQGRFPGAVVPLSPKASPGSRVMSTLLSAWIAPKCFETLCNSRTGKKTPPRCARQGSSPADAHHLQSLLHVFTYCNIYF